MSHHLARIGVLLVGTSLGLPALASGDLSGIWNGNYTCNSGSAEMTLELVQRGTLYEGTFAFDYLRARDRGSYKVTGRVQNGNVVIFPNNWIEQPGRGWTMLAMEGTLDEKAERFSGVMPECSSGGVFTATKGTTKNLPRKIDDKLEAKAPIPPQKPGRKEQAKANPPKPKSDGISEWVSIFEERLRNAEDLGDKLKNMIQMNDFRHELRAKWGLGDDFRRLLKVIDDREKEIDIVAATKRIEAIPDHEYDDMAMQNILSAIAPVIRLKPSKEMLKPLQDMARIKARAIMKPILEEAPKVASSLPVSLAGIRQGEEFLKPVYDHRPWMDDYIGEWDTENQVQSLHDRLAALRRDPGVVAEFRQELMTAANGPSPEDRVIEITNSYVGRIPEWAWPDFLKVFNEVIPIAEYNSIVITQAFSQTHSGEPSADDMARALHGRYMAWNARQLEKEKKCVSGKVENVLDVFECFRTPATITGHVGTNIRLASIKKLGCNPISGEYEFTCSYNQRVKLNIYTMGSIDWDALIGASDKIEQHTVLYASFRRGRDGKWESKWHGTQRQ